MGTAIGLVFTQFGLPIVDVILATILGFLIVYTGFGILESQFLLLAMDSMNRILKNIVMLYWKWMMSKM